jgi:hypothetical protein
MAVRKSAGKSVRTSAGKSMTGSISDKRSGAAGKVSAKSQRIMRETTDRFHKALSRLADR